MWNDFHTLGFRTLHNFDGHVQKTEIEFLGYNLGDVDSVIERGKKQLFKNQSTYPNGSTDRLWKHLQNQNDTELLSICMRNDIITIEDLLATGFSNEFKDIADDRSTHELINECRLAASKRRAKHNAVNEDCESLRLITQAVGTPTVWNANGKGTSSFIQ